MLLLSWNIDLWTDHAVGAHTYSLRFKRTGPVVEMRARARPTRSPCRAHVAAPQLRDLRRRDAAGPVGPALLQARDVTRRVRPSRAFLPTTIVPPAVVVVRRRPEARVVGRRSFCVLPFCYCRCPCPASVLSTTLPPLPSRTRRLHRPTRSIPRGVHTGIRCVFSAARLGRASYAQLTFFVQGFARPS